MATPVRIESDVVIVGSGMGGATTAYALANKGVKTLVLERGERMPREPENWSPSEIFMKTRYKPNEKWLDEKEKEFVPGVHYFLFFLGTSPMKNGWMRKKRNLFPAFITSFSFSVQAQ